ncbi:MAG: CPBP family intramembrane metalloprotease [Bacilli bacterium]|nr:CPBP family intramembrane metalloprotease [Bacilli bacterium]MDD4733930.1 CPBP family intramembrane metalloprotease [Bacilli bacterium]
MIKEQVFKEFLNDIRNLIIGFSVVVLYFSFDKLAIWGLNLFTIDYGSWSLNAKYAISLMISILLALIIVLIYFKLLKKEFLFFLKHRDEYLKKYIKYWLYGLIGMIFANLILVLISGNIANNEENVRNIFSTSPIYIYISAVFIAPLVEELVFRLSIRKIFPVSDKLYIFISGLVFAACHIIGNVEIPFDILYIFPYMSLGLSFSYIYTKTNNIFSTVGFHFIHNGIMMAIQLFSLIFMG